MVSSWVDSVVEGAALPSVVVGATLGGGDVVLPPSSWRFCSWAEDVSISNWASSGSNEASSSGLVTSLTLAPCITSDRPALEQENEANLAEFTKQKPRMVKAATMKRTRRTGLFLAAQVG